jgi:hypothetical protein
MTQGMDSTRRRSSVSQGPVTTSGGTWRKNPSKARPIDSRSLYVLYGGMSVILEINRDFPYQVALPFAGCKMTSALGH